MRCDLAYGCGTDGRARIRSALRLQISHPRLINSLAALQDQMKILLEAPGQGHDHHWGRGGP